MTNTIAKRDSTIFPQVDPLEFTRAPLRAEQTFSLNAPPEKVWALVSDYEKLPTYLSFVDKVTVDNSSAATANGVGAVRTCSIGDSTLFEDVRLWEPNRALAYSLRDGNPTGLTGHLGLVVMAPNKTGGTTVRWQFYFDHADVETVAPQLQSALQQGVSGLIEVFGGRDRA
jgi:carbon monoxide dehydrogenase subunit G